MDRRYVISFNGALSDSISFIGGLMAITLTSVLGTIGRLANCALTAGFFDGDGVRYSDRQALINCRPTQRVLNGGLRVNGLCCGFTQDGQGGDQTVALSIEGLLLIRAASCDNGLFRLLTVFLTRDLRIELSFLGWFRQ